MAKVAREMVERAGVNLDQLVDLLVKNAAAELTTFYYYTILRVNLIGLEGEGVKDFTIRFSLESLVKKGYIRHAIIISTNKTSYVQIRRV